MKNVFVVALFFAALLADDKGAKKNFDNILIGEYKGGYGAWDGKKWYELDLIYHRGEVLVYLNYDVTVDGKKLTLKRKLTRAVFQPIEYQIQFEGIIIHFPKEKMNASAVVEMNIYDKEKRSFVKKMKKCSNIYAKSCFHKSKWSFAVKTSKRTPWRYYPLKEKEKIFVSNSKFPTEEKMREFIERYTTFQFRGEHFYVESHGNSFGVNQLKYNCDSNLSFVAFPEKAIACKLPLGETLHDFAAGPFKFASEIFKIPVGDGRTLFIKCNKELTCYETAYIEDENKGNALVNRIQMNTEFEKKAYEIVAELDKETVTIPDFTRPLIKRGFPDEKKSKK